MTRPSDIPESIYERAEIFCDEHRHIEDDRELVARAFMAAGQGGASGLTKPQSVVLSFIDTFIKRQGYSPNYQEIADGTGVGHKGRVCGLIDQLQERGLVRRLPHRARSLSIVGRA